MKERGSSDYSWQSVRLELAETRGFPNGSASRAYMLHLPLREDGTIDQHAFRANPVIALFRRFWPNEPDRRGLVVHADGGWKLAFQPAVQDKAMFPIAMERLLPGDEVMIEKHDGGCWRFRVVDLSPVDPQS